MTDTRLRNAKITLWTVGGLAVLTAALGNVADGEPEPTSQRVEQTETEEQQKEKVESEGVEDEVAVSSEGDETGSDDEEVAEDDSRPFPRKEVTVKVGEAPATPDDMGIGDEVEPSLGPWGGTIGMDLATFGKQWNEAADDMGREDLRVDEFEVGYAVPSGDFTYEFADWFYLAGTFDYESGELIYAVVDWEREPESGEDGAKVMGALLALISTQTEGDTEVAAETVDALVRDPTDEAVLEEDLDLTVVRDGLMYDLYIYGGAGGELLIESDA